MRGNETLLRALFQTYRACLAVQGRPVGKAIGGTDEITNAIWCQLANKLKHGATPAVVHSEWSQLMVEHGWAYGPQYNKHSRKHPALKRWASPDLASSERSVFVALSGVLNAKK